MKRLYSILWRDHSRAHLLWAFLGTLAGFVLLLAGIQFYMDIKQVLSENRDLINVFLHLFAEIGFSGNIQLPICEVTIQVGIIIGKVHR